jgi:DNA-binding LacI/PurR family transcriptional regulator
MSTPKPDQPIASTTALARHLGLSRWTISRVLNGHPEVKAETVLRVREAMRELGFVPNPMARGLRGARTGMIGVCFQGFDIPIFVQKIAVLQGALRAAGYRALIELTDRDPDLEREVVRHFSAVKVEGVVLVGGPTPGDPAGVIRFLQDRQIPTVVIDPGFPVSLPVVEVDRRAGMRSVLTHLLDLGHERFALIGVDRTIVYGASRWSGIESIIEDRGLSLKEQFIALTEPGGDGMGYGYGRRLAERFLELDDQPTAVVALNDQVAIGAMARFQESALAVPHDISVVGFDNLESSAHVSPALTTVDQGVVSLMETAVAMLTRQLEGRESSRSTPELIRPSLVIRKSTGPRPV